MCGACRKCGRVRVISGAGSTSGTPFIENSLSRSILHPVKTTSLRKKATCLANPYRKLQYLYCAGLNRLRAYRNVLSTAQNVEPPRAHSGAPGLGNSFRIHRHVLPWWGSEDASQG